MSLVFKGVPIHGEFSSADASALSEANSRFTLFPAAFIKAGTTITLNAAGANPGLDNLIGDIVVITDVLISVGATALTVSVYDGADNVIDAGELIARVTLPVNTSISVRLFVPHYCSTASYPKIKTSGAGQVDCVLHGLVSSAGV